MANLRNKFAFFVNEPLGATGESTLVAG